MNPLVSVIIPAHNCGPYIDQTVRSVLDQTYSPVEAIIIDDGSTDDTPARLARYAEHKNVRVVRQERQGVWKTRNTAVSLSRGEFIAFLDGDDYWLPHKLARQVEILQRHPDVALTAARPVEVDADGRPLARPIKDVAAEIYNRPADLSEILLMRGNAIFMSSMLMKRSVFEEAGGFPVDKNIPSLDYDLWIRVSGKHKFYVASEPLAHYRVLENSILHGSVEKEYRAQLGIIERHKDRYPAGGYRKRLAWLYHDWADSAFFEGDSSGWWAWRKSIGLDPLNWRCWRLGAVAVAKSLGLGRGR